MQLTPVDTALNTQVTPLDADLNTYGFPPGYFVIKNVATNRLLDVESDMAEDGTPLILWPQKDSSLVESMRQPEGNNQVFFIDTAGVLCSRSSGHAIDVEDDRLVLRHRRPVSHPFPNAYSHSLPRFSFSQETGRITVTFASDPSYPMSPDRASFLSPWKLKTYILTAVPLRKPRTMMDNASELLTSAITLPFSLIAGQKSPLIATPDDVFSSGDIDLREDEILEQDRSEEGEVDDSPEKHRRVRVIGVLKEEDEAAGAKTKARRQWVVSPLLNARNRTAT